MLEHHAEYRKEMFRDHADLHRVLAMRIANTNIKSEHQYVEPTQFVVFPWEREIEPELQEELLNTNWELLENLYNN